jgi:butyryl-CoA dehydrogenase/short/branched chain acyl-CoA dehydrogenase
MPSLPVPLTQFSEEEQMFRESVREFAQAKIRPHVHSMDEAGKFEPDLLRQFFDMHLMGIEIPENYGGAGCGFFMSILAVEELSRVDASAGVIVDVQNTLVNNALMHWGSEAQKNRYLPRMASGTLGAYALSEAGSGSDAFALKTQAELKGDRYVLNGQKLWITNAVEADLFILFATVDPDLGYKGITAFIIEKRSPGFQVGKKEDKLGIRASSTCELILENCEVPHENVLGEVGKGYKVSIETLNEGRIGIGAQMVGLASGALEYGIQYVKEREQFGQPIARFQAIQFQIAELATQLEAARLLTYNAARLKDARLPFVKEAAMAKYFSSQVAEKVTSQVVELFGGYGYTKDYPAEKYFRDSKIGKIYEGTSFMQLQTIAKLVMGEKSG